MSSGPKKLLVVVGVVVALFGLWFTDNFVYPLKSESPNYSDVERAFAKLQFPTDWVEVSSSENKGMFGRGCNMFNDSGCFHKSRTFKVSETTTAEDVKKVLLAAGCPGVVEEKSNPISANPYTELTCTISALRVDSDIEFSSPNNEVYISVGTD